MVAEAERKQRLVETILSVMYLLIPGMFRQQDWHAWSKYPASGIYSHSDSPSDAKQCKRVKFTALVVAPIFRANVPSIEEG